jgi:hypothetical protein
MIGESVTDVEVDNEGLRIAFTNDWNLTIWCDISLTHAGEVIEVDRAEDLVGTKIEGFRQSSGQETLIFSSSFALVVDLPKIGPDQVEAMMLRGPKLLIVVWNE